MEKTQEKIQLLLRIVHRLNEAGVEWALGASMLLYFKGITSAFHDIDLMVADHDAECVRTILLEMGELRPSDPVPNPMYRTKTFMEFLIESIEVDVMAGFAIVHEGTVYAEGQSSAHIKRTAPAHAGSPSAAVGPPASGTWFLCWC